jgi:hypothetical protein
VVAEGMDPGVEAPSVSSEDFSSLFNANLEKLYTTEEKMCQMNMRKPSVRSFEIWEPWDGGLGVDDFDDYEYRVRMEYLRRKPWLMRLALQRSKLCSKGLEKSCWNRGGEHSAVVPGGKQKLLAIRDQIFARRRAK